MSLDNRRMELENRYVHDQELKFRIDARRNKLLGLWAAGELGRCGEAANAYAQDLVKAGFTRVGDEGVFAKVRDDFHAAGTVQSDHQIRRHMSDLLAEAEKQVASA